MANIWRGERRIEITAANGTVLSAIVAVNHDQMARAFDAVGAPSGAEFVAKVLALKAQDLRAILSCVEAVEGDPVALVDAARGLDGLDAIADVLIGLFKGQTEQEQALEKKLYHDQQLAAQVAVMRVVMENQVKQMSENQTLQTPPEKAHSAH